MELREFFSEDAVKLELEGTSKDEVLKELIGLLRLDEKFAAAHLPGSDVVLHARHDHRNDCPRL